MEPQQMSLSSVMTTALGGMRAQQSRMASIAETVAGGLAQTSQPTAAQPLMTQAETSLESQLLDLKQAETGFKANAVVFETGADLWDVLMTVMEPE